MNSLRRRPARRNATDATSCSRPVKTGMAIMAAKMKSPPPSERTNALKDGPL